MTRGLLVALALPPLLVALSCDGLLEELFDKGDEDGEALSVTLRTYDGDQPIQLENIAAATAREATTKCDRPVEFIVNGLPDKIELVRNIGGQETSCQMLRSDGSNARTFSDWPASTTVYTVRLWQGGQSTDFGPFTVTVEAVDEVVVGHNVSMGDQGFDGSGYGCFFQTRHVGWGGGLTNPNWYSAIAEGLPRLLDFATVTTGGALKAISPDLIQQVTPPFAALANDCGFMTTTFAEYTGALDPETADLTLAEVNALPDPPAAATSITLATGLRFVYRTGEGKKGLVKVLNFSSSATGTRFDLFFTTGK